LGYHLSKPSVEIVKVNDVAMAPAGISSSHMD